MRRPGTPGPRGGGVFVTEVQRARLLDATVAVVSELGYKQMTVRRVSGRAGVSNKTFYDLFENGEDCFLAAFDHAVEELAAVVLSAWEGEKEWATRIRAGLGALLGFLDREPALRRLVFVEALGAGPRVLERRVEVLGVLQRAVDEGRAGVKVGRVLPALTAEGVVGAAFSVIHTRLLSSRLGSLVGLSNELMALVVLPYRGHAAAARELRHPISQAGPRTLPTLPEGSNPLGLDLLTADKPAHPPGRGASSLGRPGGRSGSCAPFRLTVRTHLVLSAVAEHPGASNKQLSDLAGISDQGQISKLLARLEGVGLLENTGGHTQGLPNAWHLTPHGEGTLRAGTSRDYPGSSPDARRMAQ